MPVYFFFIYLILFSNKKFSEMTDFTPVKYAGVLQSFSLLKPRLQAHIQIQPTTNG